MSSVTFSPGRIRPSDVRQKPAVVRFGAGKVSFLDLDEDEPHPGPPPITKIELDAFLHKGADDARQLSQVQVRRALEEREIEHGSFAAEDAKKLQAAFISEFQERSEQLQADFAAWEASHKRWRAEADVRERLREQAAEEEQALVGYERAAYMLRMLREDGDEAEKAGPESSMCPETLRCHFGPVLTRPMVKALRTNTTVTSIDLSNNRLDDVAGLHIAKMLKLNRTLLQLDVNCNNLGATSACALSSVLSGPNRNNVLIALNLQGNPLLDDERDAVAEALAKIIQSNDSLTSLNLFGTGVGAREGAQLSEALAGNKSLIVLDAGCEVRAIDKANMHDRLLENKIVFDEHALVLKKLRGVKRQELAQKRHAIANETRVEAMRLEAEEHNVHVLKIGPLRRLLAIAAAHEVLQR